jgi:coenzyme F420-reducing hydrogenase beta subunit
MIEIMENREKLQRIVEAGACVGCGLCSFLSKDRLPMALTELGLYQPDLADLKTAEESEIKDVLQVCPFSGEGANEDSIGFRLFGDIQHDPRLGYFREIYQASVTDDSMRLQASSGGIITWVLKSLLESGKADYVVHVKNAPGETGKLFYYGISRTTEEIVGGGKSKYYPIELSEVLREVERLPGRGVFVGLPCFIKGARRLCELRPEFAKKFPYFIGLVCGHLKSTGFGESLAQQMGLNPSELVDVDFRVKLMDRPADRYGFSASTPMRSNARPMSELVGGNWGLNLFRNPACDLCDDVFAECADLVVGDAWLPGAVKDPRGTSVVVSRRKDLSEILGKGLEDGQLSLKELSLEMAANSQQGGLRDRREGLRYRLYLRRKNGEWSPEKRVEPSKNHISSSRRKLYRHRIRMMKDSLRFWALAKRTNNFEPFWERIQRLQIINSCLYRKIPLRWLAWIKYTLAARTSKKDSQTKK